MAARYVPKINPCGPWGSPVRHLYRACGCSGRSKPPVSMFSCSGVGWVVQGPPCREAGVSVLPAQTAATALGGDPRKDQVEGVAGRHGDEGDQHHPGNPRRNPEDGGGLVAPSASASARHPGILHQGARRRYASRRGSGVLRTCPRVVPFASRARTGRRVPSSERGRGAAK